MSGQTGKTKDAGYQVGARKTISADCQQLRDFLFSDNGLKIWLGDLGRSEIEIGKILRLGDGTEIKVTVFKPHSHLRMTWKKPGWKRYSRLQLRVIEAKGKAVAAFHQEMLDSAGQRSEMKIHWKSILDQIDREFG